jgi:hypothetical protein
MNTDTDLPAEAAPARSGGSLAALLTVSGLGGIVLGVIIASSIGAGLADGLDLGDVKERTGFSIIMGFIGAPTGFFAALWLVARTRMPDLPGWSFVFGLAAGIGLVALVLRVAIFAAQTPPPPVLTSVVLEVRITPGSAVALDPADTRLIMACGQGECRNPHKSFARDAEGRDVLRSTFWVSRGSPVEAIRLVRRGKPYVQFTLNLPADPPSTGDLTRWLDADGPTAETGTAPGETAELRFRIERRVER